MKKIVSVVAMLGFLATSVYSESVFFPDYQEARTMTNVGWGLTGLGVVLTVVGIGMSFYSSNDTASTDAALTGILLAGDGGGMAGGGAGMVFNYGIQVERLQFAMDIEPRLSSRERRAILENKIFVGMTEPALRASLGIPTEINRSSYGADQYVYNGIYVYVEDGKVDGWN